MTFNGVNEMNFLFADLFYEAYTYLEGFRALRMLSSRKKYIFLPFECPLLLVSIEVSIEVASVFILLFRMIGNSCFKVLV